jgi:hypothetical protein
VKSLRLTPLHSLSRPAAPLAALAAVVALATGCHPAATGSLTANGYQNDAFPYKVVISGGTLTEDWDLDNYTRNGDGNYVPKGGGIYETTLLIDANDDGNVDAQETRSTYDLRFHNAKHDATIWLRTVPLSPSLKDKQMGEVAKKYVDGVPGFGPEAVQLAAPKSASGTGHYEVKVADRAIVTLAGKDAYVTRLNVRQSPDAKWTGTEIVLVRPGFEQPVQSGGATVQVPVLLVAGYANSPDNFVADEEAFRKLLSEIEIGGRRGMTAPKPAPAPADDSAAAAPAASATQK